MINRVPRYPATVRFGLAVALCACALGAAFSVASEARQARTVADAVYSGAQAGRGQALYKAQCLACHGDALQGTVGPMLTGTSFVSAWAGRSLSDLVDKISNTMPPQAPGSVTRAQAVDIAAYILQVGKFPAGQAELNADAVAQVSFPAAARAAGSTVAAGAVPFEAPSNLAQLMRAITFPNANIIFNTQVLDPAKDRPAPPQPFNYLQWGYTQYFGWQAVDQAALALIESTPLFMLPGRRCENGRPAPIDRADYKKYTEELIALSKTIYKTAQSRKAEAVAGLSEQLSDACANCHKVYRDSASEGQGAGAARCM